MELKMWQVASAAPTLTCLYSHLRTHAYTHIHVQTYSVAGQELLDAGLSSSSEKEVPIEMEVK